MSKWSRRALTVALLSAAAATIIGLVQSYRFYLKTIQPSAKDPCLANLVQIRGAKDTWALVNKKTTNDLPTWSELIGATNYILTQPTCYKGGTYNIGRLGDNPTCTVPGHSL